MASTNQTTNFGLPVYSAGDRATWSDTNQGFEAIDTAIKKAVDDSADAQASLSTISQTANEALSTATSASADASSALAGLPDKQDKTDNALNTTSKTIVGAINELEVGKQNASDNSLDTTSKSVVGAINEVNTAVGVNATAIASKQDATDNNLVTTAKTIVGAINELAGGGTGGLSMEALWTNPSPTSAFAGQNIELSSSDYDLLVVIANSGSAIQVKGEGIYLSLGTSTAGSPQTCWREIGYTDATHLAAADCYVSGGSVVNTQLVPIAIYGIKLA